MLRFDLFMDLNASTLQGDFTELYFTLLYNFSLAFILKKISRKQPGPELQNLKKAIIIEFTVNTVICLI